MQPIIKPFIRLLRQELFNGRTPRHILAFFAVAALLLGSSNAKAACGLTGATAKTPVKLPLLAHAADLDFGPPSEPGIVGLWHVVYTAGGSIFNETFDQWHSDGTEFENAWLAPDTGNICFGVWKQTGARTVRLHHIGWIFTPGSNPSTATGTFTIDECNTVAPNGKTYTGTFTFRTYNIDGTPTGVEVVGTIDASRITVD